MLTINTYISKLGIDPTKISAIDKKILSWIKAW